jgi:glycosyltransferase involved in cell wall biosynthesis
MVELSVIITHNDIDKLKLCLNVYQNQTFPDFEIILTNNILDNSILNKFPYKTVKHNTTKHFNLAQIINHACDIASANRIILSNQNFVPNSDLLANYARYIDQDVFLAGYIGYIDDSVNRAFSEETIARITKFDPFITQPEFRNFNKYDWQIVREGNFSFTKNIYNKTGKFDEKLDSDIIRDFSLRCHKQNFLIKGLPEAKMFKLDKPNIIF